MMEKKCSFIESCQLNLVKDSNVDGDDDRVIKHDVDCCVIAPSSKRCRVQGNPFLRQPNGRKNVCERDGKSLKLAQTEKSTTTDRRWEEMNHEILILIMKKYEWYKWHKLHYVDFIVCKPWLSAFLDVLFPPGNTLDLRLLDDHPKFGPARGFFDDRCSPYGVKLRKFYHYLQLNFDRHSPNHYTKLILSECILHGHAYRGIAQRLPALKSVVCPAKMSSHFERFNSFYYKVTNSYVSRIMCGYWKNLEEARCHFNMVRDFAVCCKSIRNLSFIEVSGCRYWITDNIVEWIAKHFPLLDRLSISSFVFSFTGMSMILDGHKDLSYLDMTHTLFVPDKVMLNRVSIHTMPDYPLPKDLADKIARVKTVLTCNRKSCSHCIPIDSQYQ